MNSLWEMAVHGPKPYEFIGEVVNQRSIIIRGPKPYEIIQLKLGHKEPSLRSPGAENHQKPSQNSKQNTKIIEIDSSPKPLALVALTLIHTNAVHALTIPK